MNNELDDYCRGTAALDAWQPVAERIGAGTAAAGAVTSPSLAAVDIHALRQVSQASPAKRVVALLRAAMQITKATGGLIAAAREDDWEVVASAAASDAFNACEAASPMDRLPLSILTTAIQMHNGLVLHDACAIDHWRADDYVRRCRPRSVICMPMRCDGVLVGALYLEHQRMPGVFTAANTPLVEIVALQAGFALENARLRDELSMQHARLSSTEEKMRDVLSELARDSQLKAFGELVASIVHEVAQPVTALDTSARAGLRWLDRTTPNIDAARQMLAHISACAMRARTIISGLRAKARQTEPNFTVFDLDDTLNEVAEILACTLNAMNVELRMPGHTLSTPVRGERVPLQQAIISLLMNGAEAMRGMPEDKRLLVLTCESTTDQVHLHIDDNGEGFDPRVADRLFEPLFTTKPDGMGMGLSICRSIVDAHLGQLDLTLRPQGGTRATITLPRHFD